MTDQGREQALRIGEFRRAGYDPVSYERFDLVIGPGHCGIGGSEWRKSQCAYDCVTPHPPGEAGKSMFENVITLLD
jgi:hypothetical protein